MNADTKVNSAHVHAYAPINAKFQGGGGGGATHGKLTERAFPWVRILTLIFKRCPVVGNLTWPQSWKT